MQATLNRVWNRLLNPAIQTCNAFFTGCHQAVHSMKVRLVRDDSVNAYADAETFTLGVHTGLMRSAGSDDEIAWVLAHEAAHLLFGHAQKKAPNAAGGGVLGAIAMGAIGIAIHQPGMDTQFVGDMTQAGFETGYVAGYIAYSPEMELEADQFAAYVMKKDGRRLDAALDTIVPPRRPRATLPRPSHPIPRRVRPEFQTSPPYHPQPCPSNRPQASCVSSRAHELDAAAQASLPHRHRTL